jgi:precorrin-2/cobalt-factor-2 C20-methyltransferase
MSQGATPVTYGRLYGVGVGPGDPELLTRKALRVLQQVQVICVPQSERSVQSYALQIVQGFLDLARQEVLRLTFPTDDAQGAARTWRAATETIAARLYRGQDVAFITEGDPMLYGTFAYLLENMTATHPDIPLEIIPGVSSITAAAARAGVPLAAPGQRLAILPAAYGIGDLQEATANFDTVVLMKMNPALLQAMADPDQLGLAGKCVYVRRATTPQEQVVWDLRQVSRDEPDYFSLLIVKR